MAQDDKAVKDAAEEQPAEETAAEETPTEEKQTTEEPKEPEAPEKGDEEPEVSESAEEKPSPRMQKRIRGLSGKVKELNEQLRQDRPTQTPQFDFSQPNLPPIPAGDYTPEELDKMVNERAQKQASTLGLQTQAEINALKQQMEQERVLSNLNRSVNEIQSTHEELNPNSDKFNPDLADAVGDTIQEVFVANPYVDVEKLTKRMVDASRKAGTAEAKEVGQKVAEQASNAAVKSDVPSENQDKKFEDLSIEEMKEKLGYVRR